MNAKQYLTGLKWNDPEIRWGINAPPAVRARLADARANVRANQADQWQEISYHYVNVNPATDEDNTTIGLCGVEGTSGVPEFEYRKTRGKYLDLDHPRIFTAVCKNLGIPEDQGLQDEDAARWMMANGVLKGDCNLVRPEADEGAIRTALSVRPLVIFQFACGIMPDDLSALLGEADESQCVNANFMLSSGGHCMCAIGAMQHNSTNGVVIRNRGWGAEGLNMQGVITASTWWFLRTMLAQPLLIDHASGDIIGPDYEKWAKQ